MRTIAFPVNTYARTLSATLPIAEPSVIMPNLGPVQGLYAVLTVTIAGGTHSKASNTIDNILAALQAQDQFGGVLLDVFGTDLSTLNDILQPRGVRTTPPAITTDGSGNGTASWSVFLPVTCGAKDMPAKFQLVWAATSVLQNSNLTSAGTVTVTFNVRGAYSTQTDQPTLRVKAQSTPHQAGDNSLQAYLPNGEQVEALAWTIATDADFGYVTLTVGGAFFLNQSGALDFTQQDTMLMQSGHLDGEYICRVPVFVVDSTTTMNVHLATDTAIRLYTISTVPQKRAS
jgi:hypothetical protein